MPFKIQERAPEPMRNWKQMLMVLAVVGVLSFIIFSLYNGMDAAASLQPAVIEQMGG